MAATASTPLLHPQHSNDMLKCDACREKYCRGKLFQCKHKDCANNHELYCSKECAEFWHSKKNKGHQVIIAHDRKLSDIDEDTMTDTESDNNQQSMPDIDSSINPTNLEYTSFCNVSSQVM